MKLEIDYDMLEKIKHSKNGLTGTEVFWITFKRWPFSHFIYSINIIQGLISKNIETVALYGSGYMVLPCLTDLLTKKTKQQDKDEAYLDLQDLAANLYKLEVNTTAELLKESELLEKELKFKFVDSKPKLIEKKYIDVLQTNGYSKTILQEHVIGSKTYDLSAQEPEKKLQLKTAKSLS